MEFITDRTQADVDRIKEITRILLEEDYVDDDEAGHLYWEFLHDSKGALNFSDVRRIADNMNKIADYIKLPGYNTLLLYYEDKVENPDGMVDPQDIDAFIPRVDFFNALHSNLICLHQNSHYLLPTTPKVPDRPFNTFEKLNAIEKILEDAYSIYEASINGEYRCGDSAVTSSTSELFADENGEYMLL